MLLQKLEQNKLLHPPSWLSDNCQYLTIMGSLAYATNVDTSDFDVYGFTIPRKEDVFPHQLQGRIDGFGKQIQRFDQYIEHGVYDKDAQGGAGRTYDFTIYNIVRYFHLLLTCNPNAIDSIFTPADCVLHCTSIGSLVRDNRKLFLNKAIIPQLKGYAFAQLHKAGSQTKEGKRKEDVEKWGWDRKHLMHVVRLTLEAQDILQNGDLDLRTHCEHLKTIRRGEISLEEVRKWFTEKEIYLDKLYQESKLPWGPDEPKVKQLLLNALEIHYGSLDKVITLPDAAEQTLREVKELIEKRGF